MHGNLSSASVILQVVGKTECLLTKDRGKFLLLLDLLLVEDFTEFVECILCVTAERRDILFSLMSMVPSAMAAVVLLLASPLTGMEMFGARPFVCIIYINLYI